MAEIFLMEDSASLRRILIRQIRDAGHNVAAFENGQESDNAGLMGMADVLVTDLSMPDVDGAAVIRNVSRLHPELPIIVITGENAESVADIQAVDCVLKKPFTEEQLIGAIEAALRKRPRNRTVA